MTIISSASKNSFIVSFAICMTFISFSFLIALAGTFTTVVSKVGRSENPCLVLHLRGETVKAVNLSPVSIMLAVAFI